MRLFLISLGLLLATAVPGFAGDAVDSTSAGVDSATVAATTASTDRPVLKRAQHAMKSFASDGWYLATSPARIGKAGLVKPLLIFGVAGVLYAYDEEITAGFHRSEDDEIYDGVVTVGEWVEGTGYPGRTFPYYVGGTLLGYVFKSEPVKQAGLEIIETQFLSGGIRNLATLVIGRRREHEGRGARFFEFNGGTSFPSGHTSTNFQLAAILSHHIHWKPATAVLYGVATCAAVQRVDSKSHWPSDVWLSAVEGTLTSWAVIRRNEARRGKAATFGFVPDPRGAAFTVQF